MSRLTLALLTIAIGLQAADPRFVYPLPAESNIAAQRDILYRTVAGKELRFDLYRPANHAVGAPLPVVLFMNGVGSAELKRWPQYTGWGKAVTAIGMAGITFDAHESAGAEDAVALLAYLRGHASDLHVDADNVVLWACSSNASTGLPLAMDARQTAIKAAVIYYGIGEVENLRPDLPLLMVRAGLDGLGLNRGIDQFVTRATAANVPLTFINLPSAHHGFDVTDDNEASRNAIARTLEFIKANTAASMQRQIREGVAESSAASAVYRGDGISAVKMYEALAAQRPADTEVHRNFGNALLAAGEHRRAVAEFERALELGNPNRGWISYAAAQAALRLGDREATFKWLANLKGIPPMQRRLRADTEFAPLKDDPRFKAVLENQ